MGHNAELFDVIKKRDKGKCKCKCKSLFMNQYNADADDDLHLPVVSCGVSPRVPRRAVCLRTAAGGLGLQHKTQGYTAQHRGEAR